MTRIEYFDKGDEISISIKGHAGYDVKGNDIVCSAISMLGQTIVAYLVAECEKDCEYCIKEGYIWVHAKGKKVRTALEVIMTGFYLLEINYPEYITFERGCVIQKSP